jgi:hypothetical protein
MLHLFSQASLLSNETEVARQAAYDSSLVCPLVASMPMASAKKAAELMTLPCCCFRGRWRAALAEQR